jgi:hypothetical protein
MRTTTRLAVVALLLLASVSSAFGQASASGGTVLNVGPAAPVSVSVSPPKATVAASGTVNFTATLTNDIANRGVNWTLSGSGCSGATCGTTAPSFSRSGQAIIYTAPSSVPSPPTVTLTATSVQDSSRFANVVITVTVPPSPVVVNNFSTPAAVLTSAATNSVPITPTVGQFVEVSTMDTAPNTVTGVQACSPSSVCFNLTAACDVSNVCLGTAPGHGHVRKFYGIGLPSGLDHIIISNSPASGSLDCGVIDASNVVSFAGASAALGSTTAGGVLGPPVSPTGSGIVIGSLSATNSVTGVLAPFTFKATAFLDGVAYLLNNAGGTFQPSWLETVTPWGMTSAYLGGTTAPVISVSVAPATAGVQTNATKQFTATVLNDSKGVTWTLTGGGCSGATCGALSASSSASGVPITYTAPNAVPSPATVTLTATSVTDTTKTGTATITLSATPPISVSVAPTTANVTVSTTQNFTPTVVNDGTNAGVDWTLSGVSCPGSCGSVSPAHTASGINTVYTAPASVPGTPTVTITATSTADATKAGTATITIIAAAVTVAVAPTTATVQAGGNTQTFTPTIMNSASGVNWTVTCGSASCGSVSPTSTANGVPTTYTSPAVAPSPSTVTLTATSISDGTKSATASITVTPAAGPPLCADPANCAAFPGAQGGGATSLGGSGRGGSGTPTVYFVTNTADSGAGSLRDCIENGTPPRYCIFLIAGNTQPANRYAAGSPYMTVAGQTAPGSGFVIVGAQLNAGETPLWSESHDLVWRYLTVRIGGTQSGPSSGSSCMEIASGGTFNNVYDHISCSWFGNKGFVIYDNSPPPTTVANNTLQWSLIYQPNALHTVMGLLDSAGTMGAATDNTVNNDQHHNLCATCGHRLPMVNTKGGRWVSNIIWNWDFFVALYQGGGLMDNINNKYKAGPLTAGDTNHEFDVNPSAAGNVDGALTGNPSHYFVGNIGPDNPTATSTPNDAGQVAMTCTGNETGDTGPCPISNSFFRSTPLAAQTVPITADPAANLDSVLLPTIGNSQMLTCDGHLVNRRDSIDAAEIALYQSNGNDSYYTGYTSSRPQFPPVTPGTVCSWTNNLPDAWVSRYGLSATPTLWRTIDPVTGYTYIEDYLDGLVP